MRNFCIIVFVAFVAACDLTDSGSVDRYMERAEDLGLEMVTVDGGRFVMGGAANSSSGTREKEVKVNAFFLSRYELTVAQFATFVDKTNYITDAERNGYSWIVGDKHPSAWVKESGTTWRCDERGRRLDRSEYSRAVVHVSWQDAVEYCNWLSSISGRSYRLPSESEWEFAASGGNRNKGYLYSGSNDADKVAWYGGVSEESNSGGRVHEVGELKPNEIGFYDMSGNVWEWCSDYYTRYPSSAQIGAQARSAESFVIRGGGWNMDKSSCRNVERNDNPARQGGSHIGFRVAADF